MRVLIFLSMMLAVLIMPDMAISAPIQWSVNGHWYEVVNGNYTWDEAELDAEYHTFNGLTGHLVTLTSEAENEFVWALQDNLDNYWLGGYRADDNGTIGVLEDDTWAWVTAEEWNWANWAMGRPNDWYNGNPPEDGLNFHNLGAGTWNDAPTNKITPYGYIVEYEEPIANPEPATLMLVGSGLLGFLGITRKKFKG